MSVQMMQDQIQSTTAGTVHTPSYGMWTGLAIGVAAIIEGLPWGVWIVSGIAMLWGASWALRRCGQKPLPIGMQTNSEMTGRESRTPERR